MSSNTDGITKSQLSDKQFKAHKRRAQFERNYKRNKIVLACIKDVTPELIDYSNGVANVIAEFKRKKARERQLNTCKQN
jgi:alpha-D-ribose 1-methylphosphonate 5-triphosphate diphosphatase PhnM